jgi:hypothetical protein
VPPRTPNFYRPYAVRIAGSTLERRMKLNPNESHVPLGSSNRRRGYSRSTHAISARESISNVLNQPSPSPACSTGREVGRSHCSESFQHCGDIGKTCTPRQNLMNLFLSECCRLGQLPAVIAMRGHDFYPHPWVGCLQHASIVRLVHVCYFWRGGSRFFIISNPSTCRPLVFTAFELTDDLNQVEKQQQRCTQQMNGVKSSF